MTTTPVPETPRDAATVVLLRDAPGGLEVLLQRRHAQMTDMGGLYVFPGGKLDPQDSDAQSLAALDQAPQALHAHLGEPDLTAPLAAGLHDEENKFQAAAPGLMKAAQELAAAKDYAAAKAGLHGFTMALAQEVASKGITVNTVSPGYIATDMVKAIRQDVLDKIIATIPVQRLGTPEEIASIVTWLCEDEGGFATGADFSLNGGLHMG